MYKINKKVISIIFVVGLFVATQTAAVETKSLLPAHITKIGLGWATNTINTVIFRHHGILSIEDSQFTAYYTADVKLRFVKKNLGTGEVDFFDIPGNFNLFDAHNSISIAVDSKGYLHISYDQHSGGLAYRRSTEPHDITHWTGTLPMTGKKEERVTYPTFIMPRAAEKQRPLLFLYRYGRSGKGDTYLKQYDSDLKQWCDVEPCILSGSQQQPWTSNPYWNHPAIDKKGRIHLSFVWRTHSLGPGRKINNINIDYAVSDDWGGTWKTSHGLAFRLPITQVNAETIQAISPGLNLINQTGSTTDSKGWLHVVYYANDSNGVPQYQHLRYDGEEWKNSVVSHRTKAFNLEGGGTLQIPISRPDVVIDDADRVYMIYRGDFTKNKMAVTRLLPPGYSSETSETKILWNESVEYAEPVIDRLRWEKDRVLSMLIQRTGQPPHDVKVEPRAEPVYIVDWDIVNDW
jgi:hypothetical protein